MGLIPGVCRPIPAKDGYPVPHMGWNQLEVKQKNPLTDGLDDQSVYFVYSYFTDVELEYIDATADYSREIPAMISKGNVFGAQFHPEKSGQVGLGILTKFAALCQKGTSNNYLRFLEVPIPTFYLFAFLDFLIILT